MATILCVDDCTYGLFRTIKMLRTHGYDVLAAADVAEGVELLLTNAVDAIILNCHAGETSRITSIARNLKPNAPIVMLSGYCGVPCQHLRLSDACIQRGDSDDVLLRTLQAMLCCRRFGLCRSVAA